VTSVGIAIAIFVVLAQVVGAVMKQKAEKAEAERKLRMLREGGPPPPPGPQTMATAEGPQGRTERGRSGRSRVGGDGTGVGQPRGRGQQISRADIPAGLQPNVQDGAAEGRLRASLEGSIFAPQGTSQSLPTQPGMAPRRPPRSTDRAQLSDPNLPSAPGPRRSVPQTPGSGPGSGQMRPPGPGHVRGPAAAESRPRRRDDQAQPRRAPADTVGERRAVTPGSPGSPSTPTGRVEGRAGQATGGRSTHSRAPEASAASASPTQQHYALEVSPILTSQKPLIEAGAAAAMGSAGSRAGAPLRRDVGEPVGAAALRRALLRPEGVRHALLLNELLGPPVGQRRSPLNAHWG